MGIFDRAKDLLSPDADADSDTDRTAGLDSGESAAPGDPIEEPEPASTEPSTESSEFGEPPPEG